MNVFIAFDVSKDLQVVLNDLKNKGYNNMWSDGNTNKVYELPHNCLWKPNIELSAGKTDIEQTINSLNSLGNDIHLTKLVVLSASPWIALERN